MEKKLNPLYWFSEGCWNLMDPAIRLLDFISLNTVCYTIGPTCSLYPELKKNGIQVLKKNFINLRTLPNVVRIRLTTLSINIHSSCIHYLKCSLQHQLILSCILNQFLEMKDLGDLQGSMEHHQDSLRCNLVLNAIRKLESILFQFPRFMLQVMSPKENWI